MPLTRIQPQGLDSTGNYTFNGIVANTAIIAGNDISSGGGPKITNIQITDSSYNVLDDTAVSTSGGYIKITGTGFAAGCQVLINNIPVTSVTFVSATEVRAQVPATTAGTYVVYLVNSDGGVAIRVNGITFSGTPNWVTSSSLPDSVTTVSIQLSATSDSAIVYSLAAGSTLPTGLTLSSSGLLSGTATSTSGVVTYNFTVNATDVELQDSPRTFSITISFNDPSFPYVSTLLSADVETLPYDSDSSNNSFVLTPNGDVKPNNFNPYTPGYYSNYFDGTGDNLTFPNSAQFAFGTDSFTIEFWINAPSNNDKFILGGRGAVGTMHITTGGFSSTVGVLRYVGSSTIVSSSVITDDRWHHCAIVRNGSTNITLYVDGVSVGTGTDSTNYTTTSGTWIIGKNDTSDANYITGYISNFRIIKGTALYTSNFTPSTSPLTAVANTSLLTCQSNRLIDTSNNNLTITRTGDVKVLGFDPFVLDSNFTSRGSTLFDGTGDYLTMPYNVSTVQWWDTDYTIEMWMYNTVNAQSTLNSLPLQIGYGYPTSQDTYWSFGTNSSGNLYFNYFNGASITNAVSTSTVPLNQWTHAAMVYNNSNSTLTGYINGVQAFSVSKSGTPQAPSGLTLNVGTVQNIGYNGYISNLRIVRGTTVYTSAFTPPTAPLTAIANTRLLTCQTNRPDNNSTFLDESSFNSFITRNGNTTQGSFSPYGPLWSNYFDGTDDFLSYSSNTTLNFGTSDFTVESWINLANVTPSDVIISGTASNSFGFRFGTAFNGSSGLSIYRAGQADLENCSFSFVVNTWYHVAVTRQSGVIRFFINGQQQTTSGSGGASYSFPTETNVRIGTGDGGLEDFAGYISNLRVVKGTALYTASFTTPTSPLTAVANTSLLTCNENRFVDDSPNRFALTRNGDTRIERFSPFNPQTLPTFYSGYFDGTGDYLTAANNTISNFGTSDFTIECWFYRTTTNTTLLSNSGPGTDVNYFVLNSSTTESVFQIRDSGSQAYAYGPATTSNTWNHIAVTRSSGSVRVFVNGVSGTPVTITKTITSRSTFVSGFLYSTFEGYFGGYISNLRIVKNQALYTSNFTPSTSPLTTISQGATAANVSLLTCQSETFIDNSTNNFAITINGDARPTTVTPFTPTATTGVSYTPSIYGGSMYFDGTGDYLNTQSSAAFTLGTGDLTLECWIYQTATSASTYRVIFGDNVYGNSGGYTLYSYNNALNLWKGGSGGVELIAPAGTIPLNSWTHVAWTRSGSSNRLFINGTQVGATTSDSTNYTATVSYIGASQVGTLPFIGYISNLRIVKGTSVYTSNFVPPVTPLRAIQNTVLLLNGTSAAIYDSAMLFNYESVGNASLASNIKKYGNSSLFFDGSGDYLVSPSNLNLLFGTGDFTIELWAYPITGSNNGLFQISGTAGGFVTTGLNIAIVLASNNNVQVNINNSNYITSTNNVFPHNSWTHLALVRSSGVCRLYINGVLNTTIGSSGAISDTSNYTGTNMVIGGYHSSPYVWNGYIDDLRITRGVARYTANFTPTTTPFLTK